MQSGLSYIPVSSALSLTRFISGRHILSSGFGKNSKTRLPHLHLAVIYFFQKLAAHHVSSTNSALNSLREFSFAAASEAMTPLYVRLSASVATGSKLSSKGIKEPVNKSIGSCVVDRVSFRCSVNDVKSGFRWLFYHGRVYAEKTWRTAHFSIFGRRYIVQDFTNRGEKNGFGHPR